MRARFIAMRIFVATSYSSQVNYDTGEVYPEYKEWLESNLCRLEKFGHTVFCALRADEYRINSASPAEAFSLDEAKIKWSEGMFAIVTNKPSEGTQTEMGMAIGYKKQLVIAHLAEHALGYFNSAIVLAGQAQEAILPIESDPFLRH